MDARARLVASRPSALRYARALSEVPALMGRTARVGEVSIYPVKAFGGIALQEALVEREGLVDPRTGLRDRSVMLAARRPGATSDGAAFDAVAVSNRTEPTLALARGRLDEGTVVYDAPDLPPLRIEPRALAPREGEPVRVKLYEGGPVVDGVSAEGPLTDWARALLRAYPRPRRFAPEDVVAVHPAPAHARAVAERHRAGEDAATLFGDGAHALVASSSTLAWMNDGLRAEGARSIEMRVFRANLVVDGLPPNAEDLVQEVVVAGPDGPVRLVFASMCVRCDATRIDYATGTRPDAEPLRWLARNRPPRDAEGNSATFAVNAVFPAEAQGRRVRAGDEVRVVAEVE